VAEFVCGSHRAFVYERGGVVPVGELEPLSAVRWERVRDEISTASVAVPTYNCCELLGDLRCILHELHIERNDETVWQGPITRIEYEYDQVQVYAEDVLWQAKRRVMTEGYDQKSPNLWNVIDRMNWLLWDQCYAQFGNPWNVTPRPLRHPGDPTTSRQVFAYQFYVWEDFDKYAEDNGTDYTVINREVFFFDTNYAWKVIPPLDETHVSQFPRVVEYGNQLATRAFVSNSQGYAGSAATPISAYGLVDDLTSNTQDGSTEPAPTAEEIAAWSQTASRHLTHPAPVSVVIPENTTLMPGAPWMMADLVPGAWFQVNIDILCRSHSEWQRLHQVTVTESAPQGEQVQFTAVAAPTTMDRT
jgi:hypothetical protein